MLTGRQQLRACCQDDHCVKGILLFCRVSCCVQTNNPRKLDVLAQLGVSISGRIPCQVQAGEFNQVRHCWVAGDGFVHLHQVRWYVRCGVRDSLI
jgi:hypothetical protein